MTQRERFERWNADTKDCGYDVQPNSPTARVRHQGWQAGQAALIADIVERLGASKVVDESLLKMIPISGFHNNVIDQAIEIVRKAGE